MTFPRARRRHGERSYTYLLVGHVRPADEADQLRALIAELVQHAKDQGDLGPWVGVGDVRATIWAVRGVVETCGPVADSAWRRHLDIHLHALQAPLSPTAQPATTDAELATIARTATGRAGGRIPQEQSARTSDTPACRTGRCARSTRAFARRR